MTNLWAAEWREKSKLDGEIKHLCYENCLPVLFWTRQACRNWIEEKHGYIKSRPDLQSEPYGWRLPVAVKVRVVKVLE